MTRLVWRILCRLRHIFGLEWLDTARQIERDARRTRMEPTGNVLRDTYLGLGRGERDG